MTFPRFLRSGFCLLAALALHSCMAGGPVGAEDELVQGFTARDGEAQLLDAEEREFLRFINQHRAGSGLAPVTATRMLDQVAYGHSLDMATRNYFSHTSLDGRTFDRRMRDGEYTFNTALAENIAAGNATGATTFEQWRTSPGHNTNMLSPNFRAIGIGRAYNAASTYHWYWTTDFGGEVDPTALPADGGTGTPADAGAPADAGPPTDAGTLTYPAAVAVAGNDDTASAYALAEGRWFVASGNTSALWRHVNPACAGGGAAPDAAFKVTITATRSVLIDTVGSAFDTVLYVRRASDGAQACNNDASSTTRQSRLSLSLTPGLYYVWVDGYVGARGAYQLRYRPL